eukprot:TRINITY_DN70044_c0_g1_i1.p2 TRINITY_DN70044_c0_g1~~TRINITY_DN70044_c0_g1_i1.p2  ORF type:complete len:264 (+),score=77.46 TRINITY_DN70044_c0_g1_i1:73-792(+)
MNEALALHAILAQIAFFTVLNLVGACVARFFVPRPFDPLPPDNVPRWLAACNAAMSPLLFWPLFFLGWQRHSFAVGYFTAAWESGEDTRAETAFFCALIGYVAKDYFFPAFYRYPLLVVHHLCAIWGTAMLLWRPLEHGNGMTCAGIFLFEMGSSLTNLYALNPTSKVRFVAFTGCMTVSNLINFCFCFWLHSVCAGPALTKWSVIAITGSLSVVRQLFLGDFIKLHRHDFGVQSKKDA